jgi:hypothetical protein
MAKKEIERISIEPAEKGGHTVEHHFKRQPRKTGHDIGYEYPESEKYVFGKDDDEKMLHHVAKHLGLNPSAPGEDDEEAEGE